MAATERTLREQKRASAIYSSVLNVGNGISWPAAMAIARVELEREERLVHTIKRDIEAFRCSGQPINQERAEHCVARYEAEFAPPQRTVEEIAKDLAEAWGPRGYVPPKRVYRYEELLDELAAALGKDGK